MADYPCVELGPIAHGGHCVARLDWRVVFVRYGIPVSGRGCASPTIPSRACGGARSPRSLRRVPDRVIHRAREPAAAGAALSDVAVPRQRELKAQVLAEQLRRLAGLEIDVTVEPVPVMPTASAGGPGCAIWFAIIGWACGPWRSDELVELPEGGCRIAHPGGACRSRPVCWT
jgi:hypothetical protein